MRTLGMMGGLAFSAVALCGCAGLEARKVPLEKRLAGADKCYDGFRYYLSRPYLVVNQRIDIVTTYQPAQVVYLLDDNKNPVIGPEGRVASALATLDPQGVRQLYDLDGQLLPEEKQKLEVGFFAPTVTPAEPMKKAGDVSQAGADFPTQPPVIPVPLNSNPAGLTPNATIFNALATAKVDPAPAPAVQSSDALSIVFLPDFEEQMAVKSNNILAQTKFTLLFRDGWQLKSVTGNHDSTAVALQLLSTIRNAISDSAAFDEHRLSLVGQSAPAATPSGKAEFAGPLQFDSPRARITRTSYIEPGMYRLRKPSEEGDHASGGLGILSDLGLPVQEDVRVELLGS